jgi:UDP-N-acetylmuramyl pentapeptide synthase
VPEPVAHPPAPSPGIEARRREQQRRQRRFRRWPRALVREAAAWYRRAVVGRTRVVAVIGSFGKSTTARALVAALDCRPHPNLERNAGISVHQALLRIRPGERHRVVEVGIDGPNQMARYARTVRPDIVVVTCIGSEHNRSLGTLERTRDEKAEILRGLGPDALAVGNGDDPHVRWMLEQTRARRITFGMGEHNDVRAVDVRLNLPHGLAFTILAGGRRIEVQGRLLGRHQVMSYLAAAAVALAEGVAPERLPDALAGIHPGCSRLELVPLANGVTLLRDEFKSTLETIHTALDVLAELPATRKVVLIGPISEPPGSQGPLYRAVGARIAQVAQLAISVGCDHRKYLSGAARAGLPRDRFLHAGPGVHDAIAVLRRELRPGDLVLLKGRSTQCLQRVALALMGRTVRCAIPHCRLDHRTCDSCPLLGHRWLSRWAAGPPGD